MKGFSAAIAVLTAVLAVTSTACSKCNCRTFTVVSNWGQNRPVNTSCMNFHSITVTAPGPGQVVVRAHLTGDIRHVLDQDDYLGFSLATTNQSCTPSSFASGVESQMPDGRYHLDPSGEAVFTVSGPGPQTYYLNGHSMHSEGGAVAGGQLSATYQSQ